MKQKGERAQRIAHMTRYLPEKMEEVRSLNVSENELQQLRERLQEEKETLEKYLEDICEYLHRENKAKGIKIPKADSRNQKMDFYYLDGLEVQDFMFVEEYYKYSKYKQQRPECLNAKLNTGIGLLQACIYDLAYAISEVEMYMA